MLGIDLPHWHFLVGGASFPTPYNIHDKVTLNLQAVMFKLLWSSQNETQHVYFIT
jgi:hypothetical protein